MLITEYLDNNLVHHYSDAGFYVQQVETGDLYEDAIDLISTPITYVETDIPIESESTLEDDYAEAGRILLGEVNE